MTINLHLPEKNEVLRPTITVIGVGGAGGNAVNNMIASNLEGVNFVVANTDAQALDHSLCESTIQLGAGVTKGLGAGANPEVGRAAAEEAREEIMAYVEGSNMVFITAGMGGGTGTGAAPVVARIAKEQGILTVAVVTKPFQFEGTHRMRLAEAGLKDLQDYVDTLIMIPNQNLFRVANERTTFADAFKMADEVLYSGVRGVTDLMVKPGLINLDFADIRTVMREMGKAMMGTGEATGDRRAIEAAEAAISNPLLDDVSLKGARALLINITGGGDMTLFEVDEAANRIREEVDPDANIIFGSTFNDALEGRMRVSVVATGIDAIAQVVAPPKFNAAPEPKKPFSFAPAKTEAPRPVARAIFEPSRTHGGSQEPHSPVMPAPVRQPMPQPQAEQRAGLPAPERNPGFAQAGGAARMEKAPEPVRASEPEMAEEPVAAVKAEAENRAVMHETVAAVAAVASAPQRVQAVPPPRHEYHSPQPQREEARGFFKRMADVGRALSSRYDVVEKSEAIEQRVHVVQKPAPVESAEKAQKLAGEDQYLDIPAFLRRQAN